jgi:putative phosphoribosyl transferase
VSTADEGPWWVDAGRRTLDVMFFADRTDAGRRLGARLQHLRGQPVVVLGLPRGGVPVALEVATSLGAPLDVIVVRKLGVPFQPELGMGAIAEDGVRIVNDEIVRLARVSAEQVDEVEAAERRELERRAHRFHGDRPCVPLAGRIAVVVDDGFATGSTARAACRVARLRGASRVVLAVPVAPVGWGDAVGDDADELVCVDTPQPFDAIGRFYADFSQTSDEEVLDCLRLASARGDDVVVDLGSLQLGGHLTVPHRPSGTVVFAHGSGSSRHSSRNRAVAAVLNRAGLATLLFDLLTPDEEHDRANVFDVALLAERLTLATRWLRRDAGIDPGRVGWFGASTGAAAALWAAAEPGADIAAVVSRGGRPDLAGPRLGLVEAPTLLIVGGDDHAVLDLNRSARAQLRCESDLVVIPGATHLFEEPGTLAAAADHARDWFTRHLSPS